MKVISLIIAGGLSSRFNGFKPMAKLGNETFIKSIYNKVRPFSEKVIVVTGYKEHLIKEHLKNFPDIVCIFNPDYQKGMATSVLTGMDFIIRELSPSYVLYQPVDIPHIRKATYVSLMDKVKKEQPSIIKPSYNMRGGHPLIIKKKTCSEIIDMMNEKKCHLKQAIRKIDVSIDYLNTNDISVIQDIDTEEDLDNYLSDIRFITI